MDWLEIVLWVQILSSLIRGGKLSHEFACAVGMVAATFRISLESRFDRIVMVRLRAPRGKRNNIRFHNILFNVFAGNVVAPYLHTLCHMFWWHFKACHGCSRVPSNCLMTRFWLSGEEPPEVAIWISSPLS